MTMIRAAQAEATVSGLDLPELSGHQTLEAMVYVALRRRISAGQLRPGQRISANEAAQQLGVSRLPVIHALRRLASEGFVVIRPHREVIVADPTPEEIRGRYLIMAELEGLAAREALLRLTAADVTAYQRAHDTFAAALQGDAADADRGTAADHAFHAPLWQAAGIRQLADLLANLWDQGGFYRALYGAAPRFAPDRIAEHERILRALRVKDASELAAAIRTHRLAGLDRIVGILAERR